MQQSNKKITVTLRRSVIGTSASQKGAVYSLGLKKVGQVKKLELTPVIRGQLNKVGHLVSVEEVKVEGI